MSRFPLIWIVSIALSAYLGGQPERTTGNDIFFLDLGIVIEPGTGKEEVNRLVKAPAENVKFFVNKAPSGSVFIASTRELQQTLNRISKRIETLEGAFEREVTTLREENEELRTMVADLLAREPVLPPESFTRVSTLEVAPPTVDPAEVADEDVEKEGTAELPSGSSETEGSMEVPVRMVADEKKPFDRMVYMNAVFAYQREDYVTALGHFSKLYLGSIDEVTAGNVLYWIADSHYQMGEYGAALKTLEAIESLFRSDKRDDAVVLTGLVYRHMGNEIQAMQAFGNIIDYYPDSEYLKLAQMELRKRDK